MGDATKRSGLGGRLDALPLIGFAVAGLGFSWLIRECVGKLGIAVDPSAARASAVERLEHDRQRVERQLWDANAELRIRVEVLEGIVREDHDSGRVR